MGEMTRRAALAALLALPGAGGKYLKELAGDPPDPRDLPDPSNCPWQGVLVPVRDIGFVAAQKHGGCVVNLAGRNVRVRESARAVERRLRQRAKPRRWAVMPLTVIPQDVGLDPEQAVP